MPPRKKRQPWTKRKKKKKETVSEVLHRTFYDPKQPAGFAGYQQLQRQARKQGIKPVQVRQWLETQPGYTLHKPVQRRFSRRRVIVDGLDEQWQADLADVKKFKASNDGVEYLLIVIDVLSRYAWVRPVKSKNAESVATAFRSIFEEGREPDVLQTDQGTEFLNSTLKGMLKQRNIRQFVVYGDTKAQIVERFIRTLKNRMWRYFTVQKTHRYLDVLDDLVQGYNAAYHRSIGRSPDSVTHDNAQEVWHRLYDKTVKMERKVRYRFRAGDRVRLSKKAETFKKGYTPGWTEEVFVISRKIPGYPPQYKIEEWDGTPVEGSFYEQELQRVDVNATDLFRIDSIVKRRYPRGRDPEVLVRWRGWPEKYDSWIPARDVQ